LVENLERKYRHSELGSESYAIAVRDDTEQVQHRDAEMTLRYAQENIQRDWLASQSQVVTARREKSQSQIVVSSRLAG
jgi:hypothetical protein